MKYATFLTEAGEGRTIQIPPEVWQRLYLQPGDRLEISIKKVKSGKLDLILSENPLYKLLAIKDQGDGGSE